MAEAVITSTAQFCFSVCLAILIYTYAGYFALLAVVAFFCKPRRAEPGYTPTISLVIAAYNEEASIGRTLEQTLKLEYPPDKIEIIVVSDTSTDRTDEIVKEFQDERVTLLRAPERKGKTNAQNLAVPFCQGEVIVFADATTVYHKESLLYLATNFASADVGAVGGRCEYFDASGDSVTGLGSITFWNYENLIKRFQSRIKSLTGCSGCIYSVRRSAYKPLPAEALSDVIEPLMVLRQGYRVVFEDRALAYEETTSNTRTEFQMRIRVVSRGMSAILAMSDLLDFRRWGWISFQLISHKVLRWLAPVFLIGMFLSSAVLAQTPFFRYALLLQVAFYLIAGLAALAPIHQRWKPLSIPLYFCTLNLAALMALINVIRGRKFVVWQTVR